MTWKLLKLVAIGLMVVDARASAQSPPADSVMLVYVPDVSGSMVKAVASMATAEVEQLKRTLRPGDLYARVPFDAEARLSVLQHVRAADDIANISAVVSEKAAAGGKTSISKGLIAAREVVERNAAGRRVVLVLASDGVSQPADGAAAERKRFDAVSAWWKARPATDRIVVGIARANNRPRLEELASSLNARLVTLQDYRSGALVERAIADARAAAAPILPPTEPPTPSATSTRWSPWTLAGLPLVAIGWFMLKKTRITARPITPGMPAEVRAIETPATDLFVSVTANGQVQHTVLPVDELDSGTATLGTAGSVTVPGLAGAPVTVLVTDEGLALTEEPGTGVRINGEPLGAMTQPAYVGRECRLTHRGVAVNLQLRRAGERRAAPPIRVVAHGRRR